MKINAVKAVADDAARKAAVKPLPKVKVRSSIVAKILEDTPEEVTQQVREYGDRVVKQYNERKSVLSELEIDRTRILKERAVLSSQTWKIVADIEAKLRSEGTGAVDDFLEGKLPMPELEEHAKKIEALTDQAARLFDEINQVEHNEKLPPKPRPLKNSSIEDNDMDSINHQIRRLDDRIHKTRKKFETGKPTKNPARKAMWNEKIALDEAMRIDLKHKLKKLQYEARAQRDSQREE